MPNRQFAAFVPWKAQRLKRHTKFGSLKNSLLRKSKSSLMAQRHYDAVGFRMRDLDSRLFEQDVVEELNCFHFCDRLIVGKPDQRWERLDRVVHLDFCLG